MSLARLFAPDSDCVHVSFSGRPWDRAFLFRPVMLLVLCLGVMGASFVSATAQTAYFSGTTTILAPGFNFSNPEGVAVDASGDVFVADTYYSAVREIIAVNGSIPASPTVITVGSGFSYPRGLAVDAQGNVFVGDSGNNAVKEIVAVSGVVSSSSTVNTLGSGFSQPYGVARDASGNVYVADYGSSEVKEIVAVGGVVSSTSTVNTLGSGFSQPYGVAVDASGNVYVADRGLGLVKEIIAVAGSIPSSPTINTLGSGYTGPSGITVDASGNVYVSDQGSNVVKEILAVNGSIPASPTIESLGSDMSFPEGVAVGANGNIYVADPYNHGAKEIQVAGVNFGSVAVSATTPSVLTLEFTFTGAGSINAPTVLTQGAANLDFTDKGTGTCTTNGPSYSYVAGGTCTVDVAFTPTLPGQRMGAVQLMSSGGAVIATVNVYGMGIGPMINFLSNTAVKMVNSGFSEPTNVAVDGSGDVFVGDYGNNAVKEIVAVGGAVSSSSTVKIVGGGFNHPEGTAVDGSGDVFVADTANNEVKEIVAVGGVVSSSSTVNIVVGTGFNAPTGVAVDGSGDVFVADNGNNAVKEIVAVDGLVSSSSMVNVVGNGFAGPYGVAVDSQGDVFVADTRNNGVKEIVAVDGAVSANSAVKIIGSGFATPIGVAVDDNGDVLVGDHGNNAVKEIVAVGGVVSSSSTVTTLGSGFSGPYGVAVDARGNVFVADNGNNAVKEIDFYDPPTLTFATPTKDGLADTTDGALSVTVTNDGNATLSAVSPGLSLAANFVQVAGGGSPVDCSASFALAVGASCNMSVEFAPVYPASGSVSGSVLLTDNNLNANPSTSQAINLSGGAVDVPPQLAYRTPPAATLSAGGNGGSIVVDEEDASGTVMTSATDAIVLTVTGPNGYSQVYGPVSAINGMASFNTSANLLTLAGGYTYTATSGALTGAVANETVNAGPPMNVVFATIPPATIAAGGNLGTAVKTEETDQYGNWVSSASDNNGIYVAGPVGSGYSHNYVSPLAGGIASYDMSTPALTVPGVYVVNGYDGALTPTPTFTVTVVASSYSTTANVGVTKTVPVTLMFPTGGTVGAINVLTQGTPNLDFTDAIRGDTCSVGLNYSAGTTCVVNVNFAPKYAGARYGAVVMKDGSGNVLGSAYLNGVGTGGQIAFANTTQGNPAPSSVSTLGGSFGFSNPLGMAIDASGDVFVADTGNHAVEEIPAGCATAACVKSLGGSFTFNTPYGVAVDGAGNVFVSDNGNQAVYELLAATGYTTVNPVGNSTSNVNPKGIAVDGAGNVYVAGSNNAVYEIPETGGYTTAVELGGGFLNPGGLTVDAAGDIFVADTNNLAVKEMPAGCVSSACVTQLASIGYPSSIAIDGAGDLYLTSGGLKEFLAGGGYATSFGLSSSISGATSVAVAPNGNVYFTNGNTVEEFDYADPPSLTYATSTPLGEQDTTDGTQT